MLVGALLSRSVGGCIGGYFIDTFVFFKVSWQPY